MKNICIFHSILLLTMAFTACKKSDFLNVKPDQSLVVPQTLDDLQAILDNDFVMNGFGSSGFPVLGETGADDYYMSDEIYNSYFSTLYKRACIWDKEVFSGEIILDWDLPYKCVFYSNVVMDGLANIKQGSENISQWNSEMGSALFYRANAFYQLSQVFAPVFDSSTANTDLGIPLRLHADISEKLSRSSVQDTYSKIIADLTTSTSLLPDKSLYKTRPSKAAAYGLLSRVYLSMRAYSIALLYADSCLHLQSDLMNYNTISTTDFFPFTRFNTEVIFSYMLQTVEVNPLSPGVAYIDTTLYRSYADSDLRKQIFFKDVGGGYGFGGTYDEYGYMFGGLATDEMYLIKSECEARIDKFTQAMADVNTLLAKRYITGAFTPLTASDPAEALNKILLERRKELVMRGLRWTDLRRLNKETAFAKTIYRTINGTSYSLPPNDKRYVYPIPEYVISFNPAMLQNER